MALELLLQVIVQLDGCDDGQEWGHAGEQRGKKGMP